MAMRRTTMYSSAGKKLYAVRAADGTFKDIQTYERAHRADMARTSAAETAAAVKKAAKKKSPAKKAAKKAAKKQAKRPRRSRARPSPRRAHARPLPGKPPAGSDPPLAHDTNAPHFMWSAGPPFAWQHVGTKELMKA